MKAIDKLRKAVEAAGGTIDTEINDDAILIYAPSGYVWNATGTVSIAAQYRNESQRWLSAAVSELLDNVAGGVERVICPDKISSIRHELGDDSWGSIN